ncbi:MAG: FAD-dependent oxidoreductase, partial [Acidimicrobiia bacterium]|nr:FAD-dependent oxidoreductase [Acidimicrobiia bacterium]
MTNTRPSAAIVGGGLSGLTSAYRLQEKGWDVRVFEAASIAGGRVNTVAESGYLCDTGATVVHLTYYRWYMDLAAELGLHVSPSPPYFGVYRDGRVRLLRMDRPLRSGLSTDLISLGSKIRTLRLAWDVGRAKFGGLLDSVDFHKGAPIDTETCREYAHRALTDEIDAYLLDPICRVMQIADSDKVGKLTLFSA